jgi:hypothetical protein
MTKRDYILLAAALKSARVSNITGNANRTIWNNAQRNAATYIADALQSDNGRFDRDRFLTACGVTP